MTGSGRRLDILFLRNLYWPEDFGGNRYPFEVTARLARRGHRVRAVTGRAPGQRRPDRNEGVEIAYFPVIRGHPLLTHATNALGVLPALQRALALRPDVAIVSSYDVGLSFYLRRRRPPSVFTYHSSFYSEAIERLGRLGLPGRLLGRLIRGYMRWVERRVLGRAERIVAVSDFSRDEIVARVPRRASRVVVIPTGVDTRFFSPSTDPARDRAALGLLPDDRVAIVVGRLVGVKRYDRAIDAVARLRAAGVPLTLLVAGDGPERAALEARAAAAGIGAHVRFLGFRSGEPLRDALRAAELQLCSSDFENLSLALLEGMATGLPIVSVPTGGTVGLLNAIDPRLVAARVDPEALADAAGALLRDRELLAALSRRSRAHVVAAHEWEVVVDRLEALLLAEVAD